MNRCFVRSVAQVSCQDPLSDDWFDSPFMYEQPYAKAKEPNMGEWISPIEARRLGAILKRAVCTAMTALQQAGIEQPDAIITGTGMGCMENSEKFLIDLERYGESCLKPTLFMQSTHNTISSLIAIMLKCHGYNTTYSHKGISFESALLDAWVQMKQGMVQNVLVGAHDEITDLLLKVMKHTHPEYAMVSESSVSAVLTQAECVKNMCEVVDVQIFYKPNLAALVDFLSSDNVLLMGTNGLDANDETYQQVVEALPRKPQVLQYKHIFGENFSSSAIAFYVATKILEKQRIPDCLKTNDGEYSERISSIGLLHHCDETTWSLIRLKSV